MASQTPHPRPSGAMALRAQHSAMILARMQDTLVGHSCRTLLWDLLGPRIIPLNSDTPRLHTHMFRAPQWHSATHTHFPPRSCKSAWHGDITDVLSRHRVSQTESKRITCYHKSSRSPATRRVYTPMFRAPQWHGATQRHFPPRPRKSAWHGDITDVLSRHRVPRTQSKRITCYHKSSRSPATRRVYTHTRVSRSPVARRHANTLSTKAAQIRLARRHHERNFATPCVTD